MKNYYKKDKFQNFKIITDLSNELKKYTMKNYYIKDKFQNFKNITDLSNELKKLL